MVFIPESEVFFACSAIVFKAFQRGPTKYFLQKKILFHVDLIKMLSLISLFLRFRHIFLKIQNSTIRTHNKNARKIPKQKDNKNTTLERQFLVNTRYY
jgi:hypothetical protein